MVTGASCVDFTRKLFNVFMMMISSPVVLVTVKFIHLCLVVLVSVREGSDVISEVQILQLLG